MPKVIFFSVVFFSWVFFSSCSYANEPFNVFIKHEFNATDSITGLGTTVSIGPSHSLVKGELVTSLNYVEILDKTGNMQDFLSLDTGVRLGFYGKFFAYIEAGFELLKLSLMIPEMTLIFSIHQKTTKLMVMPV